MTRRQHPQSDEGQRVHFPREMKMFATSGGQRVWWNPVRVEMDGVQYMLGFYGRGAMPHEGFSLTEAQLAEWEAE